MAEPVVLLGEAGGAGTYLLRIMVRQGLTLRFGRFDGGREIAVPAGAYAYVGSALGRGSSGLGRRLVRHASRSEGRPAHRLRVPRADAWWNGLVRRAQSQHSSS